MFSAERDLQLTRHAALSLILLTAVAPAQTFKTTVKAELPDAKHAGSCSIHESLKEQFRKRNPRIVKAVIEDVRPTTFGAPRYIVVAHATTWSRNFQGSFDDELFGLFVVDGGFETVEKVLDIIPTPRWGDYEMRIESVTADKAVLVGKGATYGDSAMRRTYQL